METLYSKIDLNSLATRYTGKLLRRNEIHLPSDLFSHLLHQGFFCEIQAIYQTRFHTKCRRCGNQKKHLFATFPCSKCKMHHLYCRKCIMMGRISECEPLYMWKGNEPQWPVHKNPCTWDGTLTPHQQHAANRIVSAIEKRKQLLIWAVCGSGKTEMLFPGITHALKQGQRICIATPRADVVQELYPRLQASFQNVHIQALYSGSHDNEGTAQLVIATTHQLLRYKHAFDLMIVDEIDAFPYHADVSLPFAVNRAKKQMSSTIYLTATPRKDQKQLIKQNKLLHEFVPIRYHNNPLPVPKLILSLSLQKSLQKNHLPKQMNTWLKKRTNRKRQLLIFVPTIFIAIHLQKYTRQALLNASLITSENDVMFVHAEDPHRSKKVEMFRKKNVYALITTTILERGVTFPSIDVAVIHAGHDVFDEAALVQMAGRAGRSAEDPRGEVVFFHDGKTKAMIQAVHSIQAMNRRAGFI